MRVLHLISTLDPGGAEKHLADLCTRMKKSGIEVHVVYLKGDGNLSKAFNNMNIPTYKIPLERWLALPGALIQFIRLTLSIKPDLVHTHLLKADGVGALACMLLPKIILISSKHNDEAWLKHPFYSWMHGFISLRANRIITISDWVLKYMSDRGRVSRGKMQPIYYGLEPHSIDSHQAKTIRKEWGIAPDEFLIGSVARLVPQKDPETLLRAFKKLLHTIPKARLVLVGRAFDPLYEAKLRNITRELGIVEKTRFIGFRHNVSEVLKALDLFVLPSRWEGFGLVLLEAMNAGTPIVASNASAIPEIIRHNFNGYLVEPGNPTALAQAITKILQDPARRQRYTANAQTVLKHKFDPDRMTSQTIEAYVETVREKRQDSFQAAFLKGLTLIVSFYTLARLSSLAAQVLAGKILGASEYGAANITIAVATLLQIVLMLGFPIAMTKFVAQEENSLRQGQIISSLFWTLFLWNIGLAGLLIALRNPLGGLFNLSPQLFYLAVLYASMIAVYSVTTSALQGLKRFRDRGRVEMGYGITVLILFGLFAWTGWRSYGAMIASFCASFILNTLYACWLLRGYLKFSFNPSYLKLTLSYGVSASVLLISMALIIAPGRMVLHKHFSLSQVGIFSAYFTASVQFALSLLYMLNSVLIPLASTAQGQRDAWKQFFRVGPVMLLGGAGLFTLTTFLALKLYGHNYPFHWSWALLFGTGGSLVLLHGALSSLFAARSLGGLKISIAGTLFSGLGNLALNLYLTPR